MLALVVVLAAPAAAPAPPAHAHGDVVWLCEGGSPPGPCRDSLTTTVQEPDGSTRVEEPRLPAVEEPPIDCFYVYPTVSEQFSRNAAKEKEQAVVAIARLQAARFSQVCRVHAPVYRQQTLLAVGAGGSSEGQALAYGDVVEAWNDYLANHNGGRGVVLIGHSQGTYMLRQLLRKEIEPRPHALRRLVSALLLGGNVTVRQGQGIGGDFQKVPACTAPAQLGCVIAYSAFNETPPSNARFGRVREDTTGSGAPSGPEYEVLCTNPASLGANERAPLTTYVRGERHPGFIGLLMTQTWGGPQPSAPTAWLQPADRYTGRCERRDGAHVLMIEPIGSARRLNPAPEPGWGLHLLDVNLALGQLVAIVEEQARAWAAARPAAPRSVALHLRLAARCRRGAYRLRLAGASVGRVVRVDFRAGRRLVARDGRRPFRARLRVRRSARVRAIAHLDDGRRSILRRRLRSCG